MVILLFKWGREILRKSLTIYKQAFQSIFKVSWLFTFPKSADILHFQINWNDFIGKYVGV